jgi:hypothetical protein
MRLHGNVFLPPVPLNGLAARVEGSWVENSEANVVEGS